MTGRNARGPLLVLVVLAALFPVQALLSSLSLSFVFEPTAEARYREDVGHSLALFAAAALVLMAFGSLGVWELSKASALRAAAAAAVTIAIGLGVTGVGRVQAELALHPSGSALHCP